MYTLIIEDKNGVIADEFSFDRGTYLIGRVEGNDIILPSSNVSRQHARLFIRDGRCFIEDLGSANGVIVDGQRTQGEKDLGTAAQIRIGDYYLYLEFAKDGNEEGQNVVSTHIVSQDTNAFKLVRVGDAFAGEEFVLGEKQNTIGRTDDNYILLNDPSISRHHARIDNDGLVYTLQDLGSSNGTKINNKRVTSPTLLKEGDHVTFGNVEFIFMPSGQAINPAMLSARASGGKRSNTGLIIGVVVVVVLMCVIGSVASVALYWVYGRAPEPVPVTEPTLTEDQKATTYVEEGRARMQQGKYDEAIESFDRALALVPDHEEAKNLKSQSVKERLAKEQLSAGLDLKSKEQYEEARSKFQSIENGTASYEPAQSELKQVNTILANKYKQSGIDAYNKNELDLAQKTLAKSIEIQCDKEVVDMIEKTEGKMKKNRRKYSDFSPIAVPARCK